MEEKSNSTEWISTHNQEPIPPKAKKPNKMRWIIYLVVMLVVVHFVREAKKNNDVAKSDLTYTDTFDEEDNDDDVETHIKNAKKIKKKLNKLKKKKIKKVSNSSLSKKAYKKKCKKLYYKNVFFGEKDLEGKLVKLNVFVKQSKYLTNESIMTNLDFYKKWQFKKDCYDVSVKRKGSNSYVGGGSVQLYFSNKKKYKVDTSWITAGSKFTVYGEVIEWSKYTWSGYNDVSVVARYIERS